MRIKTGITPIVIHHSGKTTSKRRTGVWQPPGDRLMHSTYLRAWYDGLIFTEPNREGILTIENEFREHEPPGQIGLKQVEPRGMWEQVVLDDVDDPDDHSKGRTSKKQEKSSLYATVDMSWTLPGGNALKNLVDGGEFTQAAIWLRNYNPDSFSDIDRTAKLLEEKYGNGNT